MKMIVIRTAVGTSLIIILLETSYPSTHTHTCNWWHRNNAKLLTDVLPDVQFKDKENA